MDADPAAAVLQIAADPARVLCLASHDHLAANGAGSGAGRVHVIEHAFRPLFVVGGAAEATAAGSDVAVALDGRHDPEPLLAAAARWARLLDAPLRLVTVYEPVLSDIRRPEHFTHRRGPSIDTDLYLQQVQAQLRGKRRAGHREGGPDPDPVSVADGLSTHLTERPALVLVAGGEHHAHLVAPGVLRQLLRTLVLPVLLVPKPADASDHRPRRRGDSPKSRVVSDRAAEARRDPPRSLASPSRARPQGPPPPHGCSTRPEDAPGDRQLRLADRITAFAGSMKFVYLHVLVFAPWMLAFEERPGPTLTLRCPWRRSSCRRS